MKSHKISLDICGDVYEDIVEKLVEEVQPISQIGCLL